MSSNEPGSPDDPALRRAEAARDSVAEVIEGYVERLAAARGRIRADVDADLRTMGRLLARNTQRQLAANLTLVQGLMEARSLPAMLQLQQAFLRRQIDWAMRDWDRARTQALRLLDEERRVAEMASDPAPPPEAGAPGPPADPGPS